MFIGLRAKPLRHYIGQGLAQCVLLCNYKDYSMHYFFENSGVCGYTKFPFTTLESYQSGGHYQMLGSIGVEDFGH